MMSISRSTLFICFSCATCKNRERADVARSANTHDDRAASTANTSWRRETRAARSRPTPSADPPAPPPLDAARHASCRCSRRPQPSYDNDATHLESFDGALGAVGLPHSKVHGAKRTATQHLLQVVILHREARALFRDPNREKTRKISLRAFARLHAMAAARRTQVATWRASLRTHTNTNM